MPRRCAEKRDDMMNDENNATENERERDFNERLGGMTVLVAGLGVSGRSIVEVLDHRAKRVISVDEHKPICTPSTTWIGIRSTW